MIVRLSTHSIRVYPHSHCNCSSKTSQLKSHGFPSLSHVCWFVLVRSPDHTRLQVLAPAARNHEPWSDSFVLQVHHGRLPRWRVKTCLSRLWRFSTSHNFAHTILNQLGLLEGCNFLTGELYTLDKPRDSLVTDLNAPGMLLSKLLMICASERPFRAVAKMVWNHLAASGVRWQTELFNYLTLSSFGNRIGPILTMAKFKSIALRLFPNAVWTEEWTQESCPASLSGSSV